MAALQGTIREIHESEKRHQKAERDLGAAQLSTAKGLNRVTLAGAIFGAIGSIGIIGSLIIAKEAAVDARDALHASQRPWVVADKVELLKPIDYTDVYCHIGNRTFFKNTGNSVATKLLTNSRAVTWGTYLKHLDDPKTEIAKLWAPQSRPKDQPTGAVLAPGQTISPLRCPWYSDEADPTEKEANTGAFLVIGYIKYEDQFGIGHHTRYLFTPDTDSVRPWNGRTFVLHYDYQEAD
jgi:hypothetical protein